MEDIDFYIGMLVEPTEAPDGIVGTTLRCILADQFVRLKKGDRFFYELAGKPSSFTKSRYNVYSQCALEFNNPNKNSQDVYHFFNIKL